MKHILLIFITLVAFGITLNGQEQEHQLQIKLTGSSLSLYDNSPNLESTAGSAFGFEFSYPYSFNDRWGLRGGLGLSFLNSKSELDNYEHTNGMFNDSDGDPYTSYLYLNNWMESQNITLLEIPVVVTFQEPLNSNSTLNLYCDLGFRIGIPVSSKYEVTSGSYEDQGFYEQYDLLLKDVEGHFESVTDYHPAGDINLKTCFMLTSSLGLKYALSDKLDLLGGVRFSSTLNDIKSSSSNLTTMSSDRSRTYNGVLNSDLVKDIHPVRIGIELGVNIHL